jgi:hypothetical protein
MITYRLVGKSSPTLYWYSLAPNRIKLRSIPTLNAVSRFDAHRQKRPGRGFQSLPAWAPTALYVAGALLAIIFTFQLFFRYQYFQNNGVLWRVDRLTQNMCRYNALNGSCMVPRPSMSTSTSTSVSTSVSLKPASPKRKH